MEFRSFSTAHEMRQHYAQVHARLNPPRPPTPPQMPEPDLAKALQPAPRTPMERIVFAVSEHYAIPVTMLHAHDRKPDGVVRARAVIFHLASDLLQLSTPMLGKGLGSRDHSTVIYALRSVRKQMAEDSAFALDVEALRLKLLEEPGE